MKAIHFICHSGEGKNWRGLHAIDRSQGIYLSECWIIRDGDPQSLVGGWLYLHDTSYRGAGFAAKILGIEKCTTKNKQPGLAFRIQRVKGAGQRWRGNTPTQSRPHGGIVEADFPEESDASND